MYSTAFNTPLASSLSRCSACYAIETHAQKHRVVFTAQTGQRKIAAKRFVDSDVDAANAENVIDLFLGELSERLVGGDPVLVKAARAWGIRMRR